MEASEHDTVSNKEQTGTRSLKHVLSRCYHGNIKYYYRTYSFHVFEKNAEQNLKCFLSN